MDAATVKSFYPTFTDDQVALYLSLYAAAAPLRAAAATTTENVRGQILEAISGTINNIVRAQQP